MESSTRFKVSLLALAIGLGLFALAGSAVGSTGSSAATGDTLKIDLNSDVDYTDPALAYYQPSWELEYATELKLMNYPDANGPKSSQLVPEAAAGLPKISNGGRVYDFTVKPGFKFSNGAAVTAA